MYFNDFTKNGSTGYDQEHQSILANFVKTSGSITGFDPFDGSPCRYMHGGRDLREGLKSSTSKSITRQRCMVKGISKFLFGVPDKTLAQCCNLINRAGLKLYTAEGNSPFFVFLKAKIDPSLFFFSEYFGDQYTSGELVNGMPHQDLQRLSYPDGFFDIVLTSEVMEHVPNAILGEQEILRVLKPRGGYIFTVPYRPNALYDDIRAVIENGELKHLMEPQYHGDPVRPSEGILVFRVFSEKEMRQRFEASNASFNTYHILDKSAGIVNIGAYVHVVVKH